MRRKVVFIMGHWHSGSTLLDLLLGSHPECFSLGELNRLSRQLTFHRNSEEKDKTYPKLCGVCTTRCPFWNEQVNLDLLALSLTKSETSKLSQLMRELVRYMFRPYSYLFSKLTQSILIDSTKHASWISYQLASKEFTSEAIDSYLLYMVRDGRAVLNSFLQKWPSLTVAEIAHRWADDVIRMNEFFDGFASDRKMVVRYEELATNPVNILESMCGLIEIEFTSAMLEYWRGEHHPIGGNIGTRSLIWKARGLSGDMFEAALEHQMDSKYYDRDFYDKLGLSIRIDLRWKEELSLDQLEEFEHIAGPVNEPFKYEA